MMKDAFVNILGVTKELLVVWLFEPIIS